MAAWETWTMVPQLMIVTAEPSRTTARFAERHTVVALGNFGGGLVAPRGNLLGVAIEGAAVEALGFEEDDRVIAFDAADEQSLGIIGIRRHHDAQAGRVCVVGFGRLAVVHAAADAAAARSADGRGAPTIRRRCDNGAWRARW